MTAPTASPDVEQAQRRLRDILTALRAADDAELEEQAFFAQLTKRVAAAMGAEGAECRLAGPQGSWEVVEKFGTDGDAATATHFDQEFLEAAKTQRPVVTAGPMFSSIFVPMPVDGRLRAVLRLDIAVESEAARQGCLRFLAEVVQAVEYRQLVVDRRRALVQAACVEEERRIAQAVHASLDFTQIAFALVNESRVLLAADRVTVLRRHGRRYHAVAVSGQDDFDRRSGAVGSLEEIAGRCAQAGERIAYPDDLDRLDGDRGSRLEQYVDETHVKRLVIVPLIAEHNSNQATTEELQRRRLPGDSTPEGVLIVEYFHEVQPAGVESRRLEFIASCGTSALRNASAHDAIFLLPLWRFLGGGMRAWFAPGKKLRTGLIVAGLVGSAVALSVIPADFTAYCRGTLQPAERRRVFAPSDGVVARVAVRHGDRVRRGQVLLELRNHEFDIAEAEIAGQRTAAAEQLSAVERTLLDEDKRLIAEERARLSGERSKLREQMASLDRQLELYAERRRQLVVVSPIDGEVTTWNADDLLAERPVRQGQQLLTVADVRGPWELELRVPDDRSGRVVEADQSSTEPLIVSFNPAIDPGTIRQARVVEIQNSAEIRGDDGNTVLVRATVVAEELPHRRPGAEAAAHIHCGRRPIGYVWFCDLYNFLRGRVWFRWLP